MKAYLTLWNDGSTDFKKKVFHCSRLIVSDGVELTVDGQKLQLFDVVSANEIVPHVAEIEIV